MAPCNPCIMYANLRRRAAMKNLLRCFLLGFAILLPQDAFGCTIPVFRYALEKWDLTPYDILVYQRGALPAETQTALKKWTDIAGKMNFEITTIDLDGEVAPALLKLWQREGGKDKTPWMLVRYRPQRGEGFTAWTGPCTSDNLHNVIDSPRRQAILKQLAGGASVVFVLLTSGDAKADDAARAMAEKELRMLEKQIKLPVQSEDGPKMRLPLPLKVSLPVLTLDRNDPAEAGFVRLLLATEEDLDQKQGPILFPIFGRGRVLGSLSEEELTAQQILEVTKFLCRECSCQVKELNPGIDMLLALDWNGEFDRMFEGKEELPISTATPASDLKETPKTPAPSINAASSHPSISAVEPAAARPCQKCRAMLWIGIGVAVGLLLLTGGWALMRMSK
jgi:hypothetical protein